MEMIKLNKFEGKETLFKEAVFLGGTCGSSTWRDELAEYLDFEMEGMGLVDPRVSDYVWERDSKLEELAKENCPIIVFGITNTPNTASIYSFVEASWLAAKGKTVIVYCNPEEFEEPVKKSIKNSLKFLESNGIILTSTINELAWAILNRDYENYLKTFETD